MSSFTRQLPLGLLLQFSDILAKIEDSYGGLPDEGKEKKYQHIFDFVFLLTGLLTKVFSSKFVSGENARGWGAGGGGLLTVKNGRGTT